MSRPPDGHGGERKGPLRAFIKSECVEGETYVRESDHAARLAASHAVIGELYEALQAVESYLVERGIETRGVTGRTIVLPKIKAALAKAANREVKP